MGFGVSRYQILVKIQPFLTIQGLNSGSSMEMEFGLIVSLLGLNMPPWTQPGSQHHMMVCTGIHHHQKGAIYSYFPLLSCIRRKKWLIDMQSFRGT